MGAVAPGSAVNSVWFELISCFFLRQKSATGRTLRLAAGVAIDAPINGPFGKHSGAGRELSGLPGWCEVVFVRVVFDQATTRVFKIPKVSR